MLIIILFIAFPTPFQLNEPAHPTVVSLPLTDIRCPLSRAPSSQHSRMRERDQWTVITPFYILIRKQCIQSNAEQRSDPPKAQRKDFAPTFALLAVVLRDNRIVNLFDKFVGSNDMRKRRSRGSASCKNFPAGHDACQQPRNTSCNYFDGALYIIEIGW